MREARSTMSFLAAKIVKSAIVYSDICRLYPSCSRTGAHSALEIIVTSSVYFFSKNPCHKQHIELTFSKRRWKFYEFNSPSLALKLQCKPDSGRNTKGRSWPGSRQREVRAAAYIFQLLNVQYSVRRKALFNNNKNGVCFIVEHSWPQNRRLIRSRYRQ